MGLQDALKKASSMMNNESGATKLYKGVVSGVNAGKKAVNTLAGRAAVNRIGQSLSDLGTEAVKGTMFQKQTGADKLYKNFVIAGEKMKKVAANARAKAAIDKAIKSIGL